MTQGELGYCAAELRRHDRPRFLTALFAPRCRREDLFALYAFNLEIAKTLETVSEKMLGRIRLQWWRETIAGIYEGNPRQHEVALALAKAIANHGLPRENFEALIEARESDLEEAPPADLAALAAYAEASAGTLVALAARILVAGGADAPARAVGTTQGLAGLLLALPFRLRHGRIDLPADRLAEAGLGLVALRERRAAGAAAIVRDVAAHARQTLAEARARRREMPRAALPALLVSVPAERQLGRLQRAGYDPFDSTLGRPDPLLPLALSWAHWRGRY
jgi:NADH dehydrogenase [ubiquinone] 1 alpha subcomplex assembly factor 6